MDVEVVETGNGGDLIKNAKDLSVILGFENMPYIGMFGGNVKSSTPTSRIATEQAFDFWGNNLLMPQDSSIQFNSETERALNTIPLTSSGRNKIQQAVENDLAFMTEFATVEVTVSIIATDSILIAIRIKQPDNLQTQDFIYIWDATNRELIDREFIQSNPEIIAQKYFDFAFEDFFE